MIRNNDKISPYQLGVIVIMAVIGVGVFNFIRDAAQLCGNDGWLIVGIYGIINVFAAFILIALNSRFPGKTFPQYIQEIIGVIPGKIVTFLFVAYILCNLAYEVREFTEVAKMFLLFRTPTEIIMIALILTCVYVVRGGVECVGRISELIFPLLFIPFILILLPGTINLDLSNLLPIFQKVPQKFVKMIPYAPHAFRGFEYILFYIGFMKHPKKAYKPVAVGILFVTAFYVFTTLLVFTTTGAKSAAKAIWPLMNYIRSIDIPGAFIERLDGIALALWVMTVFTTIVTGYFIASYSCSKIIDVKEQKQFVLPLAIVIFYLALQPDSLAQLYEWGHVMFEYASYMFIYVIPIILLLIAAMRKLGVKSNEKA